MLREVSANSDAECIRALSHSTALFVVCSSTRRSAMVEPAANALNFLGDTNLCLVITIALLN